MYTVHATSTWLALDHLKVDLLVYGCKANYAITNLMYQCKNHTLLTIDSFFGFAPSLARKSGCLVM